MQPQFSSHCTAELLWHETGQSRANVVVIGAGIAGLSLALRLPETLSCIVVTKGALGESNTRYAQGGLAAAVGPDDGPDLHLADTLEAGAGLCDTDAVRELVTRGPEAVRWLLDRGTHFDEEVKTFALGKEAAHSRNRVLHAGGDATGAEIERALVSQLRARQSVRILENTTALELVEDDGRCVGVVARPAGSPDRIVLIAASVVLANGGAGQLWSVTSNPEGATGDGIAMALRAGVAVADLEFTQFHPTVLSGIGVEPFLISEAVRGEGAYLRSARGERFMLAVHPLAELAPRDVVARAIQLQTTMDHGEPVVLDLRHLPTALVAARFPTIRAHLARYGLSLEHDLIPVAPAAHYFMGGVVADTHGRTSMPGLYAIGEVSCTGVHGANRLASNSLLEGLVFGLNTADEIAATDARVPTSLCPPYVDIASIPDSTADAVRQDIQQAMTLDVGVVRNDDGLARAHAHIAATPATAAMPATDAGMALRNTRELGLAIAASSRNRRESRGGHFRSDFPEQNPVLGGRHQVVQLVDGILYRTFGSLAQVLDSLVPTD